MTTPEDPTSPDRAIVDLLAEIPLWSELSEDLRSQIAAAADVVRVQAGDHLFRHGDAGDALYVVRSGRLEVVGPSGTLIGVLGHGTAVGELALLTGQSRTATVRAVRDSELIRVGRDPFHELLRENAEFAASLTTFLGHRLAGTIEAPPAPEPRNVVAVVALSPDVPIESYVEHLQRTIEGWSRVGTLEESNVGELGPALDRCERQNDVVLLAARMDARSEWREFCLRQADRVLLLVDAGKPPPGLPDERLEGRDLAFWGRTPPSAASSGPWLDALRPRARHWVPAGQPAGTHLERAARRMFGRSVGIVLSGGGARGLAHIGVVSALQEAGTEIDRYGGTSMGAFVAALFATGMPPEEVTQVLRREVAERRPFADYTLPRHGLIRAHRARRMFRRVFEDLQVEELPYDWFGVTADLITAETLVHRRGPLRHIVSASMSLPGLAPPMPWGGRLLVDGGVVNNLPIDVMADTGEGPVIAVEVMRRWQEEWERRIADARLRTAARTRQRRPSPPVPIPSLVETLACSIGLGSRTSLEAARKRASITVTPDLPGLGLLDWGRLDEAVAEGRRAARETLSDLARLP